MGQYEIYDIGNNAILSANSLGQIGTDWGFVTLGGFYGSDTTDAMKNLVHEGSRPAKAARSQRNLFGDQAPMSPDL